MNFCRKILMLFSLVSLSIQKPAISLQNGIICGDPSVAQSQYCVFRAALLDSINSGSLESLLESTLTRYLRNVGGSGVLSGDGSQQIVEELINAFRTNRLRSSRYNVNSLDTLAIGGEPANNLLTDALTVSADQIDLPNPGNPAVNLNVAANVDDILNNIDVDSVGQALQGILGK